MTRRILHMSEGNKGKRVIEVVPFHWESPKWAIDRNCSTQIIVGYITATLKFHNKTANKTVNYKTGYLRLNIKLRIQIFVSNYLKIRTYKTLRLERPTSSLGIDPVSLLLFSRLPHQFNHIQCKLVTICELSMLKSSGNSI